MNYSATVHSVINKFLPIKPPSMLNLSFTVRVSTP